MRSVTLLGFLLITAVAFAGQAQAQDPGPILTCDVNNSNPMVSTQDSIRCSVLTLAGAPLARAEVVFMFTFESGTDASFEGAGKAEIKTTDGSGRLTMMLTTGEQPGTLGVLANFASARSSFHVISVESVRAELPPAEPVEAD